MLEEQAPWLSLAVSVLLCLAGAILVDQRANLARWHASTARGFSQLADRPDRHSPRRCRAQSSTCHVAPVHRWHGESRSRRVPDGTYDSLGSTGAVRRGRLQHVHRSIRRSLRRSPALSSRLPRRLLLKKSDGRMGISSETLRSRLRPKWLTAVRKRQVVRLPIRRPQFSGGKAKSIGRSGD